MVPTVEGLNRGMATTSAHSGVEAIDSKRSRLNLAMPPLPPNASVTSARTRNILGCGGRTRIAQPRSPRVGLVPFDDWDNHSRTGATKPLFGRDRTRSGSGVTGVRAKSSFVG